MSQFSNFKDYVFRNLFPYYYRENDTYKDSSGKGILERFIEVCSEYFDKEIMPDIDNLMDIIDVDKTSNEFLNYIWQYFDYIPYAYGAIVNGNYSSTSILNDINQFPRADSRRILKYAISLFKIRGTADFYRILGRFYGVSINIEEVPVAGTSSSSSELSHQDENSDATIVDPADVVSSVIVATYSNTSSWYDQIKAGYSNRNCLDCIYFKVTIGIPQGMYEALQNQAKDNPNRWDELYRVFNELIKKYLPVYARLQDDEGKESVVISSMVNNFLISSPRSEDSYHTSQTNFVVN